MARQLGKGAWKINEQKELLEIQKVVESEGSMAFLSRQ